VNPGNFLGRTLGIALLLTFFLVGAANSAGQGPAASSSPTPSSTANEIGRLVSIYKARGKGSAAATNLLSDDTQFQRYLVLSKGGARPVMADTEQQRVDKQTATTSGSGASTSAVSNGSVPWLFGFAVEHGALTQSVDNNVITFKGNVANLIKAINTKDYVESYRKYQDDTIVNLVSRASFSVSFVTSQGPTSTTTNQGTLAGYSAHIDLYNHRDPRDKRYIAAWSDVVAHGLTGLATSAGSFHDFLDAHHPGELAGWTARATATLATLTDSSSDDNIQAAITSIADDYVNTFGELADIQTPLKRVGQAMKEYAQQKGKVVDKIENSPILSVEYTNTRQSATTGLPQPTGGTLTAAAPLPDLSNINVIYGFRFISRSQGTFNAGATFFNSLPTGSSSGSVRDWRVSGQIDVPLPEIPEIGKSTLTFSGLFLSLLEEPLGQKVLVNGVAESRTGNIGLFQAKFSVPVKGAGVKIPISLTASNRTELIKEKDVRGSVGITLDLDSIFSKAGSNK
jgi:hypothetical protein